MVLEIAKIWVVREYLEVPIWIVHWMWETEYLSVVIELNRILLFLQFSFLFFKFINLFIDYISGSAQSYGCSSGTTNNMIATDIQFAVVYILYIS